MAVDSRWKRASATVVCQPWMWTVHTDTTAGVDDEERWAAAWMYMGIGVALPPFPRRRGLLLGVYP